MIASVGMDGWDEDATTRRASMGRSRLALAFSRRSYGNTDSAKLQVLIRFGGDPESGDRKECGAKEQGEGRWKRRST